MMLISSKKRRKTVTDSTHSNDNSLPENLAHIAEQMGADLVKSIEDAADRPITAEDIQYLLDHYPYLQILNDRAEFAEAVEPQFVRSHSGWVIHDYIDAMTSSPGEFLFSHADSFTARDDEGGSGGSNPGKGTIINQAFVTASQMVQLAIERGWMVLRIVDGHPVMKWAAWMTAHDAGLTITGYKPSKEDVAKRERVQRADTDFEKLRSIIRPRRGR